MRHPPDKRKPAAVAATGSRNDIKLGGFDVRDNSESLRDLQAARLRSRFLMSLPLANVVAELHFGRATA